MSGITGAINTALTGIEAFETGIGAVSENLTNQSTPGYAQETVNLATSAGGGVQTAQVSRAADGFAAGLLRSANSASQAGSIYASALTNISNALQNNGDIQSAIDQFFTDTGSLAANPSSSAARQTVLSDAQNITESFQSAAGSLSATMTGATRALQQNVTSANNLLAQLADINQALAASPSDPSLLDQQEAALNSLSALLPVNVLPQSNGQVLISTGGTMLLDQSGAQELSLNGGTGSTAPVITAGTSNTALTSGAADGAIGANLSAWAAGSQALQGLATLAAVFAANVNTSQAEGLTAAGQQGGALFSVPAPSVTPASGNTGSAVLSAQLSNASQLPSDGGPFLLSYNAASGWSATDKASGASVPVTANAGQLAFAGIAVAVTGIPASGDQFIVNPAPNAAQGIAVAATDPNAIAAADPYVATPGSLQSNGGLIDSNAGTISAGTDLVTATPAAGAALVPASYYGQSLQVTFTSATEYNVETATSPATVLASGSLANGAGNIAVAYPAGAAAGTYWQLPISGTPASGDVLTLTPGGSNSGSNAYRMAQLWTTTGTTSAGSLQQATVGFVTSLGANAQQAQQTSAAAAAQVTAATTNLQNISRVSSDQQAVELTNYQQAYQAAAQVISSAHAMFESLLQAV